MSSIDSHSKNLNSKSDPAICIKGGEFQVNCGKGQPKKRVGGSTYYKKAKSVELISGPPSLDAVLDLR